MARYIDAEQAIHLIENDALSQIYYSKSDAIDCINATPTADVVEVVRCNDCKHWRKKAFDPIVEHNIGECHCAHWENDYFSYETFDNDFCSYGTPKERGGEK